MLNELLFVVSVLSFIFLSLAILYTIRQRKYEDAKLRSGMNVLILGLTILDVYLVVKIFEYFNILFKNLVDIKIVNYLNYAVDFTSLAVIPTMAICFLVAILFFREV